MANYTAECSEGTGGDPEAFADYTLPHHIWVHRDAFGRRYETYIGPAAATIYLPQWPEKPNVFLAPIVSGVDASVWTADEEWATTWAAFGADDKTALRRIALQFRQGSREIPVYPPSTPSEARHNLTYAVQIHIAGWFHQVANWASIVTGEDLNYRSPVYPANEVAPGLRVRGDSDWLHGPMRITTPRPRALSFEELSAIFDRVAAAEEPPVEWELVRDSLEAFVRLDYRKAVLDAATAVEVCLMHLIATVDQAGGRPSNSERRLRDRGLVSRSEWLNIHHPAYEGSAELSVLAKQRNEVIHSGAATTRDSARQAVQTAIDITEGYGRSRDPRASVIGGL